MISTKTGKRHNAILEMLRTGRSISVDDFCSELHCSASTIRNDLNYLAEQQQVIRIFGGAKSIFADSPTPLLSVTERNSTSDKKSSEIAHYVAQNLICPHSSIILDIGSTCEEIAWLIAKCDFQVTVLTFSLAIANILAEAPNISLYFLGGYFDRIRHAFYDDSIGERLKYLHADTYFMTTSSVSPEAGFTISCQDTPITERALMGIATKTIALCDSSNISKSSFRVISDFTEISTLVTDSAADTTQVQRLLDAGLHVMVAESILLL